MRTKIKYLLLLLLVFTIGTSRVCAEEYTKDEIDNRTYIIGNHIFDRNTVGDYEGELTIKYIMLAAKSIEGNTLDDMVIYYKNPRGTWVDGATGTTLTPPETFNVRYVDMEDTIHVATPTLHNFTEELWNEQHEEEYEPVLSNGAYHYILNVDSSIYSGNDFEIHDDYRFELYEVNDNQMTYINDASIDGTIEVSVMPGESKVYKARVYVMVDGEKVYSEYSNEIPIDRSEIPAPVLHNVTVEAWTSQHPLIEYSPNLINGKYRYEFSVSADYLPTAEEEMFSSQYYFELYAKSGNQTSLVSTEGIAYAVSVGVEPGDDITYYAKVCININNNKVCSEKSNEINLKPIIRTPVISNLTLIRWEYENPGEDYVPELEDGVYTYELFFDVGNYAEHDILAPEQTYGFAIYEKDSEGEKTLVASKNNISEPISVTLEPSEKKTYVGRVFFVRQDGTKAYSNYSENEIIIDHSEIPAPIISNMTLSSWNSNHPGETYVPTLDNNSFTYDFYLNIAAYEYPHQTGHIIERYGFAIYEKNGTETSLVASRDNLGDVLSVDVPIGETKTYVGKVFYTKLDGTKVYSDFSENEISIDATVVIPTLHNKTEEDFLAENPEGTYVPELVNGTYTYVLTIDASKYKWINELGHNRYYYEIYEKVGTDYTLLNEEEVELETNSAFQVDVGYGEAKTFVAKVYAYNKANEKVYCEDYSNEIVIDTR